MASLESWFGLIASIIDFVGGIVLAICTQVRHARHDKRIKMLEDE
jgi:hypothetical protein